MARALKRRHSLDLLQQSRVPAKPFGKMYVVLRLGDQVTSDVIVRVAEVPKNIRRKTKFRGVFRRGLFGCGEDAAKSVRLGLEFLTFGGLGLRVLVPFATMISRNVRDIFGVGVA